ncbi:hypothetical protein I3760_12G122500 [Carya illinoinensis]|nr:hypothetical protein I3760_12G122500 [Carya illinoinensis]
MNWGKLGNFAREKTEKVPHFRFYKNMEKIHEGEGIHPEVFMGDVLYYGDNHYTVEQNEAQTKKVERCC